MRKHFSLPKEFADKWLTALRSGKYKQDAGYLLQVEYPEIDGNLGLDYDWENPIMDTCRYCCLGVAASIQGKSLHELSGIETLDNSFNMDNDDIPIELFEGELNDKDAALATILMRLNDNLSYDDWVNFMSQYPNLKFIKTPRPTQKVNYSFKEIADWVEENVDFYEE